MKRFVPLFFVVIFLGCHGENRETKIAVDENGNVTGTLPDGTSVGNEDEYAAGIAAQTPLIEEMQPMALTVSTATPDGGAPGVTVGKFRISIAPDASYLDGCVRKKFMHLKVVIESSVVPAAMIELHLVVWIDNGKPCIAVMNTGFVGYGWCYKLCASNPKTAIKEGIKGGLVAAGVGATTAAVMSLILTPVTAAAFAL